MSLTWNYNLTKKMGGLFLERDLQTHVDVVLWLSPFKTYKIYHKYIRVLNYRLEIRVYDSYPQLREVKLRQESIPCKDEFLQKACGNDKTECEAT